jgi:hypothetical protein
MVQKLAPLARDKVLLQPTRGKMTPKGRRIHLGTGGDTNPSRIKDCERCSGKGEIWGTIPGTKVSKGMVPCPACQGKRGQHLGTI